MKKNWKISIILVFSIIMIVSIYTIFQESKILEVEDNNLKILLSPWPPTNILYIAQEKGVFEKNGINVELDLREYDSNMVGDFYKEDFDGINIVYTDIFMMNSIYDETCVVYVGDISTEGDFVISNVDSIEQLKGKKIGVTEMFSFSYFFVLKMLESAGLDETDVELVTIPVSEMLSSIKSKKIDAGHSFYSADKLNSEVHVIAYASDYSGIITDTVSFKKDSIKQKPKAIEAFVKSYSQIIEYCKINKIECAKKVSEKIGWSEEEILENFDSVHMLSIEENYELMTNYQNPESLYSSGKFISNSLYELNQINDIPNLENIIHSEFVKNIYEK